MIVVLAEHREGVESELETLLVRLETGMIDAERLTVVIGTGLTRSVVPGVSEFVELGRQLVADHSEILERYPTAAETYGEAEYKKALKLLGQSFEGQPEALTAQAVLRAYNGKHSDPAEAEEDFENWSIPEGLRALAEVVAKRQNGSSFDTVILTSNFDPLVELALRQVGSGSTTVAMGTDSELQPIKGRQVSVVHFHGFWRGSNQIHSELAVSGDRPSFQASLVERIREGTTIVCGYGGWNDSFTRALKEVPRGQPGKKVLWACYGDTGIVDADLSTHPTVLTYGHIDVEELFPRLAAKIVEPQSGSGTEQGATATSAAGPPAPMALVSAGARLRDADKIVTVLDQRFDFQDDRKVLSEPRTLYWPVRLRPPSLVHLVQATIAGLFGASGMSVELLVDDLGSPTETLGNFRSRVDPWYEASARSSQGLVVTSLREFLDQNGGATIASQLNPWQSSVEFMGSRTQRPSVLDVLIAAKVIRGVPKPGELEQLLSGDVSDRLLTHATVWTHLKSVLEGGDDRSTMTLGGVDERPFWAQWRLTSDLQTRHLYTPEIVGLDMDRGVLRPTNRQELQRAYLQEMETGPLDPGGFTLWCYNMLMRLPIEFGMAQGTVEFGGQAEFLDAVASDRHHAARTLAVAVYRAFTPEPNQQR